jgi:hypothetical protein
MTILRTVETAKADTLLVVTACQDDTDKELLLYCDMRGCDVWSMVQMAPLGLSHLFGRFHAGWFLLTAAVGGARARRRGTRNFPPVLSSNQRRFHVLTLVPLDDCCNL